MIFPNLIFLPVVVRPELMSATWPPPQLGAETSIKTIELSDRNLVIELHLQEVPGTQQTGSLGEPTVNHGSNVLVFDVTNEESFQNLDYWFQRVQGTDGANKMDAQHAPPNTVLVANKTDGRESVGRNVFWRVLRGVFD